MMKCLSMFTVMVSFTTCAPLSYVPKQSHNDSLAGPVLLEAATSALSDVACADGASNIALHKDVSGSSSSSRWGGGYQAVNDGSTSSKWHDVYNPSSYPDSQYLVMDLGRQYSITGMDILTPGHQNYAFQELTIKISSDGNDYKIIDQKNKGFACAKDRSTHHPGWSEATRFIRIEMRKKCGGHNFAISEWTVTGCVEQPTPPPPQGQTANDDVRCSKDTPDCKNERFKGCEVKLCRSAYNCRGHNLIESKTFTVDRETITYEFWPVSGDSEDDTVGVRLSGVCGVVVGDEDNDCRDIDYAHNIRIHSDCKDLRNCRQIGGSGRNWWTGTLDDDVYEDVCGIWVKGGTGGNIPSPHFGRGYVELDEKRPCARSRMIRTQQFCQYAATQFNIAWGGAATWTGETDFSGCQWANHKIWWNTVSGLQRKAEDMREKYHAVCYKSGPNEAECWSQCLKSGPCDFCGDGRCCRKHHSDGGCSGFEGGEHHHMCVGSSDVPTVDTFTTK